MTQPERIARSFYEAWNNRDFDRSAALMHDNAKIVLVGSGERFIGPEGARKLDQMWADGFPDGKVTIDRMVAAGNCVIVQLTGRGTHTGTLDFPGSPIRATGRSVTLQLCDVIEVKGEKIEKVHSYFDSASLLMQLGVMPEIRAEALLY
jgi:steroid delta-isomerase-like uncharacterized protein